MKVKNNTQELSLGTLTITVPKKPTRRESLQFIVDRLNDLTGQQYRINRAYGKGMLVMLTGGGERNISPRLPHGQLMSWMGAYLDGMYAGMDMKREEIR